MSRSSVVLAMSLPSTRKSSPSKGIFELFTAVLLGFFAAPVISFIRISFIADRVLVVYVLLIVGVFQGVSVLFVGVLAVFSSVLLIVIFKGFRIVFGFGTFFGLFFLVVL